VDFAVTEDETFIITDRKDEKIRIFDNSGSHLKSWGTRGQGPGEFQAIGWSDYSKPYFILLDLRTSKIFVYQRKGLSDFKLTNEIRFEVQSTYNIAIDNNRIFFDGTTISNKNLFYISSKDLNGKNPDYFLPTAVRYGLSPEKDYAKPMAAFAGIYGTPFGYLDTFQGSIYSVWIGELKIIKIDIKTKKWEIFSGEKTNNYRQPKIVYIDSHSPKAEKLKKDKENLSWVRGVFADKNLMSLLYLNFDRNESIWTPILQLYNPNGTFLTEEILHESFEQDSSLKYFYNRENGCLYILIDIISETGDVEFEIHKYKILK